MKIIADGDSVTAYPHNYTESYAADISAQVSGCGQVTVRNVAVSGQSQAKMLERLPTMVLPERPDILTLCTSLNDIGTPKATLVSNITRYVELALSITSAASGLPPQLILMTDNSCGQELDKEWARPYQRQYDTAQMVLEAYRKFADNPNVQIVDHFSTFYALGMDTPALYATMLEDRVHPNAAGYSMIRKNMRPALIRAAQRVAKGKT